MTVNEIIKLIPDGITPEIVLNGSAIDYNRNDRLHVAAFGDMVVNSIFPCGTEDKPVIELIIKTIPERK